MSEKVLTIAGIARDEYISKIPEGAIASSVQLSVSLKTSDVTKGIKRLNDLRPSVILIDMSQIEEDQLGFIIKLRLSQPDSHLIVISEEYAVNRWLQILKAGARGILDSGFSRQNLASAVSIVSQGGIYLESGRMSQFIEQCANKVKHAEEKAKDLLTDREIQVLKVLAEGYTVKKAAEILDLSPKTVDTHKANLMRKINIHRRADLIKYALRKKIISLQEDD